MRKLILVFVLFLTACTVPVTQKFPSVPATLMMPPTELKEVPAGSTSSVVFETVIENYGTYYEIANRLKGWQQWYIEQKKIFETAK